MKFLIGMIALLALVFGFCWVAMAAWDRDTRKANDYCHSLGAEPNFTQGAHALCVTPDGRVVGHI